MDDRIARYVKALTESLERLGADPAVIQDAAFDAAEHLDGAVEGGQAVDDAVEEFGSPDEVAAGYLASEIEVERALRPPRPARSGLFSRPDTATWASVAYMLLSLGTGIAYFMVAVAGVAVSASLAVFIIGIPVFLLFLGVVRSISLIEGRIIETLLGSRMPRRPLVEPAGGWLERFKHWLRDRRTWTSVVYMAGQLPLGIAYFVTVVVGTAVSAWFMVMPWVQAFTGAPFLPDVNGGDFHLDAWAVLPASAAGILLLFVILAIARLVGRLHARYAKWMLVGSLGRPR